MVTIMMEGDWSTFPGINMMVLRKQIDPIITSRADVYVLLPLHPTSTLSTCQDLSI